MRSGKPRSSSTKKLPPVRTAWTYQGGGEDGEEDAEAEHDTVAGGLREDGDTAEEAARGGEGRVSGRSEEDVGRSN